MAATPKSAADTPAWRPGWDRLWASQGRRMGRESMAAQEDNRLAALMRSAQDGDSDAYRHVLRACVPLAGATARQQGVPSQMVDDVVQNVLVSLHQALSTYDARRPFAPWLRAIAARHAIDALRRYRRSGARAVHGPAADLHHAETPTDFVDESR